MHSSLAVTLDGLPLGLSAAKFWTRSKFKGTNALKKKINPTRVPIEQKESFRWLENMRQSTALFDDPARCIHIGDRESDIYELFCLAQELGTHFLVRTCVDRLAGEGDHTIADEMHDVEVSGRHPVEVRDSKGNLGTATVEIRYRRIRVLPPIGKQKRYPALPSLRPMRQSKNCAGMPCAGKSRSSTRSSSPAARPKRQGLEPPSVSSSSSRSSASSLGACSG
jgi:hypothetical protein